MKNLLFVLLAGIILSSCASFRRTADCSLTEEQMKTEPYTSKDQGDECINEWTLKVKDLNGKLQVATDNVTRLQGQVDAEIAALKKCNDDLYALIGASDADIAAFAQRLGALEGKIREMKQLSDDALLERQVDVYALQLELNALRAIKISVLPQFYDRMIAAGNDIKGLYREKKRGTEYIVGTWAENRDCLWNISAKPEIYGDPFQWPKIWQGNTDQIRNPDIIHPGQRLVIPAAGPKTSEEMKAERSYWRKKRAAMNKAEIMPGTATAPAATTEVKPAEKPAEASQKGK
ncbi:MAG: LysM peptidoglycan-binding domain-containing protein [Ignavibacteriae bacterium]|nr:LysM peptidoglycan-binding domain-containing protein [Ignavibacteriota bacterium]